MKESLGCHNRIRKLLVALLDEPDPQRFADIVKQERFPPRMPLSWVLKERLSKMYYDTLNELVRELVPQHAAQSDLAQAFWELFGEVAANPTGYAIPKRLTKRLDKFAGEWKRPLKPYEVAYRIQNLDLGTGDFAFGAVRFFTLDDAKLMRWGVSRDSPLQSHLFGDFTNRSVATIQIRAADDLRAFETGLRQVLAGLDLLRLAGRRGLISTLNDEMFLWKLDGLWIARQIEDVNQSVTHGWYRPFRPLIVDMGTHIRKGLESEYGSLQVIANAKLPEEIAGHLERAINWISTSVTRERLDDKVVDLCTALEILLLPGYEEGRKGQKIDLRQRLIGGSKVPGGVLKLYELRSDIVHGSALNVSGALDYWYLLLICFEVLDILVMLAKKNPQVQKLKDLINTCETKESLEDFIRLCEVSIFKGKWVRKVKQEAKLCLKKLQEA